MFSDKTKEYFLSESKQKFEKTLDYKNEKVKAFDFGEVLFKKAGESIYAFKNKCPHQGSKFEGCEIKEGNVVCPWHKYKFDLKTGRGHGLHLETYELKETEKGFCLFRTYFSWFGE